MRQLNECAQALEHWDAAIRARRGDLNTIKVGFTF
ncbi:hypothetical protein H9Q72_014608, partial [Fusarium xylarioides]